MTRLAPSPDHDEDEHDDHVVDDLDSSDAGQQKIIEALVSQLVLESAIVDDDIKLKTHRKICVLESDESEEATRPKSIQCCNLFFVEFLKMFHF